MTLCSITYKYFFHFQFLCDTCTWHFLTSIFFIFNFHAIHLQCTSFIFILSWIESKILFKNIPFATYARRAQRRISMIHIQRVIVTPAVYQRFGFIAIYSPWHSEHWAEITMPRHPRNALFQFHIRLPLVRASSQLSFAQLECRPRRTIFFEFSQRYRSLRCTVLRWTITICIKILITCILI